MKSIKKNVILIVGLLVLFIGAYKFSFLKTIQTYNQFQTLNSQANKFNQSSNNIDYLRNQKKYYDSILIKHQLNSKTTFQNKLLMKLNEFSSNNNIKILKFQKPFKSNVDKSTTQETYHFLIEGSYTSIVSLIFTLEQKLKMGKIINASFVKKKNFKMSKEFLQCTIYLQKYANNNSETDTINKNE